MRRFQIRLLLGRNFLGRLLEISGLKVERSRAKQLIYIEVSSCIVASDGYYFGGARLFRERPKHVLPFLS